MPAGFSFRPNEIKAASRRSRRILECLECGFVAKRGGNNNNPKKAGFVGCRNNRLLGRLGRLRDDEERVRFVASFHSRLGEHLNLRGGRAAARGAARRSLALRSRDEPSGLKRLLCQSTFTTVQAHFDVGRTRVVERYGRRPGGGPTVRNEERPRMFHSENERFRPWVCVREGGCCLDERGDAPTSADVTNAPREIEEPILAQMDVKRSPRRLQALERALEMDRDALVLHLRALQKEGKVKLDASAADPNTIRSVEPRRRARPSPELEERILDTVLGGGKHGGDGKNRRKFGTPERSPGGDVDLLPVLRPAPGRGEGFFSRRGRAAAAAQRAAHERRAAPAAAPATTTGGLIRRGDDDERFGGVAVGKPPTAHNKVRGAAGPGR